MTYVDPMKRCMPRDEACGRWRWNNYCHLTADSLEELHEFAGKLGLKRAYFQNLPGLPHYDLTLRKRILAIKLGAKEVTTISMIARQINNDASIEDAFQVSPIILSNLM